MKDAILAIGDKIFAVISGLTVMISVTVVMMQILQYLSFPSKLWSVRFYGNELTTVGTITLFVMISFIAPVFGGFMIGWFSPKGVITALIFVTLLSPLFWFIYKFSEGSSIVFERQWYENPLITMGSWLMILPLWGYIGEKMRDKRSQKKS